MKAGGIGYHACGYATWPCYREIALLPPEAAGPLHSCGVDLLPAFDAPSCPVALSPGLYRSLIALEAELEAGTLCLLSDMDSAMGVRLHRPRDEDCS